MELVSDKDSGKYYTDWHYPIHTDTSHGMERRLISRTWLHIKIKSDIGFPVIWSGSNRDNYDNKCDNDNL